MDRKYFGGKAVNKVSYSVFIVKLPYKYFTDE